MKRIALIYMGDGQDFFIENPPEKSIEKWLKNVVNDIKEVEHVEIFELGEFLTVWNNPDC